MTDPERIRLEFDERRPRGLRRRRCRRVIRPLWWPAEANALAAESIAIERGVGTQQIAQTEAAISVIAVTASTVSPLCSSSCLP